MEPPDETDAQRLLALERLIRRADGFALAFARVNAPSRRRELVADLLARLGDDVRVTEVDVPDDTTDLEALLARRYAEANDDGKRTFFVYGIERILSSVRERTGFLPVLNYKRENLQRSVPCPVVVWVPEFALRHIARGAPDVWAWRSGVFEFSTPRDEVDQMWNGLRDSGSEDEYARMMPDERKARIETLEALYHDYTEAGDPNARLTRADIAGRLGRLYRYAPDPESAVEWTRRAVSINEEDFGRDHPNTLGTVNNLALLLEEKGDLAAAEPLFRRALDGSERVLGPDHPDTLGSVNNLGLVLVSKGDLAAAEPLFHRALDARARVLGPDHPSTFTSMSNLASFLKTRGDLAAAEPLFRRALDGFERVLGRDHPNTLGTVNNLALLLEEKGDLAAAEPLFRRALDGSERVLGPDHLDTLTSVGSLGVLIQLKGDLAAAEPLFRRALDGFERVLGSNHPNTQTARSNLAALLDEKATA
ncbi:MAG: tetratricopeptide repeat protein [Bacteroidota bacterium]